MKKVYFLVILFLSGIGDKAFGQPPVIIESSGFFIDQLIIESWNSGWSNSNIYHYAYDEQGRKSAVGVDTWNLSLNNWERTDTSWYSYNTDNTIDRITSQTKEGSNWKNKVRYQYTYTSEGKESKEEVDRWDGTAWQDSLMNTTTYDINNHISIHLKQKWNGTSWEDVRKITYTVNTNGTVAQKLEEYWTAGWQFSSRDSYTYDAENKRTEEVRELHNGSGWDFYAKFTYTYNDELLISSLTQQWNSSSWRNDRQFVHTYNGDGSIHNSVNQEWVSGAWNNLAKFSYTYSSVTGHIASELLSSVKISPNPFIENITINFSEENTSAELKLYNQQGSMVKQITVNSPAAIVNLAELIPGVYYVSFFKGDKIENRKLVKLE